MSPPSAAERRERARHPVARRCLRRRPPPLCRPAWVFRESVGSPKKIMARPAPPCRATRAAWAARNRAPLEPLRSEASPASAAARRVVQIGGRPDGHGRAGAWRSILGQTILVHVWNMPFRQEPSRRQRRAARVGRRCLNGVARQQALPRLPEPWPKYWTNAGPADQCAARARGGRIGGQAARVGAVRRRRSSTRPAESADARNDGSPEEPVPDQSAAESESGPWPSRAPTAAARLRPASNHPLARAGRPAADRQLRHACPRLSSRFSASASSEAGGLDRVCVGTRAVGDQIGDVLAQEIARIRSWRRPPRAGQVAGPGARAAPAQAHEGA